MRRAPLLLAAALAFPRLLPAQDGSAVIQRAAAAYQGLSAFRANFVQVIDDPMIGRFDSRGVLAQSGSARLAMRFSDPAGEAIIMDGRYIWLYTPSTAPGQVIRSPVPENPGFGPNVLGWILDRPAARYHITEARSDTLGGRTMDVVTLTPSDWTLPFSEAVVWLDRADALPRRLEVIERSGARRILTFSDVRSNPRVDSKTFAFEVPAGVRVVEQ